MRTKAQLVSVPAVHTCTGRSRNGLRSKADRIGACAGRISSLYATNEKKILELAARGALFVLNHSGGKDSQAMTIGVRALVPAKQLLVIHAVLPEVTWQGDIGHIWDTAGRIPLVFTRAVKTFFEMVDHRQMWPSPDNRQCTSDLKRGPIEREIRRWIKQHKLSGLVVNCMGLRAEESPNRAKAETFKFNQRNSRAGREWYDWLPIHHLTTEEVFATIYGAGEKPHWVYAAGMTRLSCCFCIMASKKDLCTAAKLVPELYARYVAKEQEIDQTLTMPPKTGRVWLEQVTGVPCEQGREGKNV